jgi:hypothetical protein
MTRPREESIRFPVRLHRLDRVEVIRLPRPMGGSAKLFLRDVARNEIPEYHRPIVIGISGRTNTGEEIPINTVGRWLFGTPGYMGHVKVSNWEGNEAQVEWPSQAPDVVYTLIAKLKAEVEGLAVNPSASEDEGVLERAMRIVQERRPNASIQHKAAFANSVYTMVTGWSGGFGGPSVREHAAGHVYGNRRYPFDEAVELLMLEESPIFGPIADVHHFCWENEHCFDNDPSDAEQLNS